MPGQKIVLLGLAPGPAVRAFEVRQAFDIAGPALTGAEALRASCPPEPAAGQSQVALRGLLGFGCALAEWPEVLGLGWEAAGTALSPAYFRQIIGVWLNGGAFPGLGLVALTPAAVGLRSNGLALFTGYELNIAPGVAAGPAAAAKLAVRAMHGLVEAQCPPAHVAQWLGDPGLTSALSHDGRLLTIERQ